MAASSSVGGKKARGKYIDGTETMIVARPRTSGNFIEDHHRKQLHVAKGKMMDWCAASEGKVLSIKSLMDADMIQHRSVQSQVAQDAIAADSFSGACQTLQNIPRYWKISYLQRKHPDIFSLQVLDRIDLMEKSCAQEFFVQDGHERDYALALRGEEEGLPFRLVR
eukprot:TRINITY_DN46713_c0_g1_i1.p1 TRINITY_DN46713_c0_g1~~TRINITY_DN46713_c0_g1_i1.p1  ORF type:complete len:180 (-),score=42.51 TRINITY_DN46713_c0_g1_i1:628-1125(-)